MEHAAYDSTDKAQMEEHLGISCFFFSIKISFSHNETFTLVHIVRPMSHDPTDSIDLFHVAHKRIKIPF